MTMASGARTWNSLRTRNGSISWTKPNRRRFTSFAWPMRRNRSIVAIKRSWIRPETAMGRGKKPRGSDARLARLHGMRNQPATPETISELRRFLVDASSVIVAEAARIIKDHALSELAGNLVQAFDRLMIDPEERDKHCQAKIEIVDALNRLEHADPDVFLRGLTHRQDLRFGEPGQDAA